MTSDHSALSKSRHYLRHPSYALLDFKPEHIHPRYTRKTSTRRCASLPTSLSRDPPRRSSTIQSMPPMCRCRQALSGGTVKCAFTSNALSSWHVPRKKYREQTQYDICRVKRIYSHVNWAMNAGVLGESFQAVQAHLYHSVL